MAMRAARSPSQGNGSRNPNMASEGMVCSTLATPITGLAQRGERVSQMPRGDGDEWRKQHGRSGEPEMLERERGDFAAVLRKKRVLMRLRPFAFGSAAAVDWPRWNARAYATISGCSDRRNSSLGKICDDSSFTEQNDAVCEIERFIEIVGYQQNGGPQPVQKIAEHVLHLRPRERIERAKGLVHEQDLRLRSESAGQADALPLPSGKLMRIAMRKRRRIEADQLQQFVAASDSLRHAACPSPQERCRRCAPH